MKDDSIFFKRQSKRSYLDKIIEQEKLRKLYEIIRWTPSCGRKQPWRIIFVQGHEQHEKVVKTLARGNEWAGKAPVIAVVCGKKEDDINREDNPVEYYQFDCGMATLSLLLGAVELGLMGHPMAGYDAIAIKKVLEIPNDYHVFCVVSLGYPGTIDMLDEITRKKDESPRSRKEIKDIIALDSFHFDN